MTCYGKKGARLGPDLEYDLSETFSPVTVARFCIPKFGKKIRHAGARSKMHTKIRRVCSEKAHFAENIFRMHFLVEER